MFYKLVKWKDFQRRNLNYGMTLQIWIFLKVTSNRDITCCHNEINLEILLSVHDLQIIFQESSSLSRFAVPNNACSCLIVYDWQHAGIEHRLCLGKNGSTVSCENKFFTNLIRSGTTFFCCCFILQEKLAQL
jgi:hypothetical protein